MSCRMEDEIKRQNYGSNSVQNQPSSYQVTLHLIQDIKNMVKSNLLSKGENKKRSDQEDEEDAGKQEPPSKKSKPNNDSPNVVKDSNVSTNRKHPETLLLFLYLAIQDTVAAPPPLHQSRPDHPRHNCPDVPTRHRRYRCPRCFFMIDRLQLLRGDGAEHLRTIHGARGQDVVRNPQQWRFTRAS